MANSSCDTAEQLKSNPQSNVTNDPRGTLLGAMVSKAKSAFGSAIGQAAFNTIKDNIPKIAIGNNVNSNIRSLTNAVNHGTKTFTQNGVNSALGAVYTAAGINPNVIPKNTNDKTIFDNGKVAANFLSDKIISGVIEELDLPAPITALTDMAFVQQVRYDDLSSDSTDITDPSCGVSPYARDLLKYAPKHNFMFMVQFIFQPDYKDLGVAKDEKIKFHFLCHTFDRPAVSVDYEEVNMYNFHTRVAKRITYAPVRLRLYDDIQNQSMVFLEKYLKIRSPVARNTPEQGAQRYERAGMRYGELNSTDGLDGANVSKLPGGSASMGGLISDNISVLKEVTVFHIFNYGNRVNKYTFINPKIQQFDLNEFSMDSQTEVSSIEVEMAYDSMYIETDVDIPPTTIQEQSRLGEYSMYKYSNS